MVVFGKTGLSRAERALVDYAEKLTARPGEMSRADVDGLRAAGLGDEEILSVDLVAAYFNFVNRIALGLGVEYTAEESAGYNY